MHDRVVIITGGGTGIGRAAAMQFAQTGAEVLIAGRRAAPLEETARASSRIVPVPADLSHEAECDRVIQDAVSRWGRVDVLVNNAGRFEQRPLAEVDSQLISSLSTVNVLIPSLLSRTALSHLQASHGSIINVSSTFGHKAAPLFSHYAASKAALEHLTRCWALELAPHRIRVNAVAPGPTETEILTSSGLSAEDVDQIKEAEAELVPLGRRGTADEVASWIVRLADPEASWVTGQVMTVDGGLSVT